MKKRILLFAIAAVLLACFAFSGIETGRKEEGRRQLEQALRRMAVACFAMEGFYPPDVAYMQQHYGLQYDERNYIVYYEYIASNLMPDITVLER